MFSRLFRKPVGGPAPALGGGAVATEPSGWTGFRRRGEPGGGPAGAPSQTDAPPPPHPYRREPPRVSRETLDRVRRIRIRTRSILESGVAGSYHAVFKGRGMEFAEVREYQPGDDVRTIDWNVTARTGLPHVKKFVEERDLTLLLLADVSGSQRFGSRYLQKREFATELCAVLAFSAVANHDRVGAVLFSDRIERYVPPARGLDHAQRIVRDLLTEQPRGRGTDLAGALRFARQVLRRRSIVVLVSDFQDRGYERGLGSLRRRHDVVALHLVDPNEAALPNAGLVRLHDPEHGGSHVVDLGDPHNRRALAASTRDIAAEAFRRAGVDALALTTTEPYERPLRGFFEARGRRR